MIMRTLLLIAVFYALMAMSADAQGIRCTSTRVGNTTYTTCR